MEIYTLPAALHFCAKIYIFPVGQDPLHSSLRKKEKEEGTVNYVDRGRGMKRCNYEEELKVLEPGMNRTELCIIWKKKKQWINISLDFPPALPGAASYDDCTDNLGLQGINSTHF